MENRTIATGPVVPSSMGKHQLRRDDSMPHAGALIMARLLDTVRRHERGVRAGDVDALHDMRVATRRLRTALSLFATWYSHAERRGLRRGLRGLGSRLGAVRDLDVLLAHARAAEPRLPEADLAGFLAEIEQRRARDRVALLAYLDGEEHRLLCTRFQTLVERHLAQSRTAPGSTVSGSRPPVETFSSRPRLVRDVLPAQLWLRYSRVCAYETNIAHLSPRALHCLRRDARRLRYTLAAFAVLLGDETAMLVTPLKAIQDVLGEMNDAVVVTGLLVAFERRAGRSDRVGPYLDEQRRVVQGARLQFERVWPAVISDEYRSRIGAAAVSL